MSRAFFLLLYTEDPQKKDARFLFCIGGYSLPCFCSLLLLCCECSCSMRLLRCVALRCLTWSYVLPACCRRLLLLLLLLRFAFCLLWRFLALCHTEKTAYYYPVRNVTTPTRERRHVWRADGTEISTKGPESRWHEISLRFGGAPSAAALGENGGRF